MSAEGEGGLFSPQRSLSGITGRLRQELGAASVPHRSQPAAGSGQARGRARRRDTPRAGELRPDWVIYIIYNCKMILLTARLRETNRV